MERNDIAGFGYNVFGRRLAACYCRRLNLLEVNLFGHVSYWKLDPVSIALAVATASVAFFLIIIFYVLVLHGEIRSGLSTLPKP